MKKESLYLRIPVCLGEMLDMLAYEQEQTKNDLVIDLLWSLFKQPDSIANDGRWV